MRRDWSTDIRVERLSSFTTLDGSHDVLRRASNRLVANVGRIFSWFRDKRRQIRSLSRNEDLIQAVLLSPEKSPVEGSRYRVGERLIAYNPDGEIRRFKICGVQSGGFSNVYTVIDLDEMRPYCLKENRALPGDERIKNGKLAVEAEISLRLGPYRNLVTTYAAFLIRGRFFILSEYIPAASLDLRLNDGPLLFETALGYAFDLCRALHNARATLPGFVHGDIKPGNCFITTEGYLKLGDFGLASATGLGKHSSNGVQAAEQWPGGTNTSIGWGGTAAYMAPEMFDKVSPDRKAADIYAFGVTLFEMLGGTRPFVSVSKSTLAEMHRHKEPPLEILTRKNVPSPIVELIRQCLSKSPEQRPVSFESVENILRQSVRDSVNIFTLDESLPEQTETEITRRALSLALLGNHEHSVACIDSAMLQKGRSPELLAYKAIALSLTGRIPDAYEASTASLRMGSDMFIVLLAHAQVLLSKGSMDAAENYLDRALRLRPDNCVALNLMGGLLSCVEQYDEARICFGKSLTFDAGQPKPWEELANINFRIGRKAKAITLAERALSIDPYRSDSHRILGDVYRSQEQFVEAIKSYKAALRLETFSKETVRTYVRSCCEFYRVLGHGIDTQLIRILIQGATVLQNAGERKIAPNDFATNFIRVFRKSDFSPLFLFFLDTTLGKLANDLDSTLSEELCESLRILWERSQHEKVRSYLLYSLGRIFYHLGEYEDCQNVFKRILEQVGPNETSFYYLAACCEIREDLRSSLGFYKKALRIEDSEDARTGIQRVTAKMKQLRQVAERPLS